MRIVIGIIIIVWGLQACSSKQDKKYEVLKIKLIEINPNILNAKSIIVIPREGCGDCIQNATHYVKSKIDSIESVVIFTGVGDKKLLKIQLGENIWSYKNKFFIDTGNILMASELTSIYPVLISLEKNEIKNVEVFSPIL
jgi:hypothetical protein